MITQNYYGCLATGHRMIPHPEGHDTDMTCTNQCQHTFHHQLLGDDEAWIHQGGQLPLVMGNLHHTSQLYLKTEVFCHKCRCLIICYKEHDRFVVNPQGHQGFPLPGQGMSAVDLGYIPW